MFKNKLNLLIIMMVLAIMVSGCSISFKNGEGGGNDGGIYVTANQGNNWVQKVLIPTTSGQPGSFGNLNASSLAMDPSDPGAIYFGSVDNGLLYTYNGAGGWFLANGLGKVTINAIAVDPVSKCIIYAGIENKVYKSTDCNRTWAQVYYDNDVNTIVNTIAIDHYNSVNVFIGTSRGEAIKSSDRGGSWKTIGRFENSVQKIVVSPADSRLIFAATAKKGIFRSTDGGANWVSLEEKLKDFKNALSFKDLAVASADKGLIFLATNYGLLKSADNGDNWAKIELITPEKEATINSIAVGPKNSKEVYYVTNTTFYRSLDGGANWTTKKLPTTRAGWKLLINPENPNIIYLGARKIEDNKSF
ncbi:MAG: YCF48-related protein [Patescibacteria group bacterium]|nr:YCF48-related protein [Patescibacteria group bacterium]MDD5554623.1 YCF48-related protein [Patescibacteria group bacterium]